jgi:hypothetical protein
MIGVRKDGKQATHTSTLVLTAFCLKHVPDLSFIEVVATDNTLRDDVELFVVL